ncbi:hypothetical protein SAMN05660690_1178 [Geodermatophilus telluris]|uniref:Uncharacterized protein n=1 Tax=Geodermatophilus telluris TaxID=1190417 RepID=A0A1G6L3K5_9ACTN|nr:hypothetical protein [Geodermatophilus telluris]SDC37753.1 hypothetical protein SAMN05660690_1178 [Geodermatophilus telluris]
MRDEIDRSGGVPVLGSGAVPGPGRYRRAADGVVAGHPSMVPHAARVRAARPGSGG